MLYDEFHKMLAVYWVLYVSIHSIMASLWFKKIVQQLTGKYFKAYRLFYSCAAAILLIAVVVYQYSHVTYILFHAATFIKLCATLTTVFGLYIVTASVKRYFFRLSGIQVIVKGKLANIPQTQGPNAYVRHPLYAGTLLLLWSLFILFPLLNNLIACTIITVYTFIGIHLEEKKLEIEYGDHYKTYRSKTPMIIPNLKRNKATFYSN